MIPTPPVLPCLTLQGATGSGKSTITRLIVRFYDVAAGAVRVDGVDVRDVTLHSLRRAIGVVPQVRTLHVTARRSLHRGF